MTKGIAAALCAVLLLVGSAALGCSSPTKTVTTVETLECDTGETGERECQTIGRITTVEKQGGGSCDGLLSCSFTMVGKLIELPFRILGSVLDVLF